MQITNSILWFYVDSLGPAQSTLQPLALYCNAFLQTVTILHRSLSTADAQYHKISNSKQLQGTSTTFSLAKNFSVICLV